MKTHFESFRWFSLLPPCLCFAVRHFSQAGSCSGMTVGQLYQLERSLSHLAQTAYGTRYLRLASLIPTRRTVINFIGSTVTLHADFGSGMVQTPDNRHSSRCSLYNSTASSRLSRGDEHMTRSPLPAWIALDERYPGMVRARDRFHHKNVLESDRLLWL